MMMRMNLCLTLHIDRLNLLLHSKRIEFRWVCLEMGGVWVGLRLSDIGTRDMSGNTITKVHRISATIRFQLYLVLI